MDVATDVRILFAEYQVTRDPRLREQLITSHIQLVHYVAGRMLPGLHSSVEKQDLVSYGMFGLMDAIERYDPAREVKFSTFASYRIQGAINDEMRALAWEPRSVRALHRRILASVSELEHRLGRAPTEDEVATHVGVTVAELRRVDQEMRESRVSSLSMPLGGESDSTLQDLIQGDGAGGERGQLSEAEASQFVSEVSVLLAQAMCRLPTNERVLLQLIYVQEMMLKDIARVLHVTDSWVSHLHTRAMVSLQRVMSAQY